MARMRRRAVMPPDPPPELPEEGDIVIGTVAEIIDHGAYVALDEFDGMRGFLHIGEIAPGWIRSIRRHLKDGEKKVLRVKRVDPRRSDVFLSLKQVSAEQRKMKMHEAKKYEKGRTLLDSVRERAGLTDEETARIEASLDAKFSTVHDAFLEIARAGGPDGLLKGLRLPPKAAKAIAEVSSKIRLPSVEIRGIMEITSARPDGVEVIKKALSGALGMPGVEVTYLGAPKYRIAVTAKDFKSAERELKPIVDGVQRAVEKKKGSFAFSREESRKTREG